jgi:uncharacterized coiled-coil protein SlyX
MTLTEWLSPVISLIAIATALGKLFQVKASIDLQVKELDNRVILLSEMSAHQDELLRASLNQVKEVAEHVRTRTRLETKGLNNRLTDVECFLEKTSQFVRRYKE